MIIRTYSAFNARRKQKCGCIKQWHCGGDWTIRYCKKHRPAEIEAVKKTYTPGS